jgi:actin beta/gamma 1
MSSELEREYELPDGQVITIANERFRCPEPLFQPSFLGMSAAGVHETAYNAIMKCNTDDRPALWENIVLSGGTTRTPGFDIRLREELRLLLPSTANSCVQPSGHDDQAFVGASLLAASSHFPSMCLSRERWAEEGAEAIHSACPHGDLSVTQGAFVKSARKG